MILILVRHFTLKCGGRVLLNHVSDGLPTLQSRKRKADPSRTEVRWGWQKQRPWTARLKPCFFKPHLWNRS